MSSSLFRKEALEHQKDRLFGDVILLQPLSITLLVAVVVLIVLMVISILFWGTYARKETVKGYLIPDKGIVKTFTQQPGTIGKIHIREGDSIKEGQPLVTILSERSIQGGSDVDTLLIKELNVTREHLIEKIAGEKSLHASETLRLENLIQALKKELTQLEESIKNQQDRMASFENRVKAAKKLSENNNLSQHDYQKLYEEFMGQKQQYQELLRKKVAEQNELAKAQTDLEQLPIRIQSSIRDIESRISEHKQKIAEIEGRRSIEIRAPIAGTITAIQSREGQQATQNTPLLAIIPQGAILQAELLIPSRAIGFIKEGQKVRIRYEAFPYRRFGIYEGVIVVISKHALLPNELSIPLGDLKEPVYRVTINIDSQSVSAYGQAFPLQAGMMLEADIILDKQTLFSWILDPIMSLRGRV